MFWKGKEVSPSDIKKCARCGMQHRPHFGAKIALCADCRSTVVKTQWFRWSA